VRAKVEHPFRVIKRQFGLAKVRFRGLAKNTAHVTTLFALSNLWMARRQLMAMAAVRPRSASDAQTRPMPLDATPSEPARSGAAARRTNRARAFKLFRLSLVVQ
jgi:hypothetical protein